VSPCECLKRRQAAVCGNHCGQCDAYLANTCCGCGYQLGLTGRPAPAGESEPSWPKGAGSECAIFRCCVGERGLEHCGLCPDFPCQLFLSHSAPLDVARRYRALLRRAEIGTVAWLDEQASKDHPKEP
jgi:hypothetical protein